MKKIFFIAVAFSILPAHAVDTSNCHLIPSQPQAATTAAGAQLNVHTEMMNDPTCWGADQSGVAVSYTWLERKPRSVPKVAFWIRVNAANRTVVAFVSCRTRGDVVLGPDTSGDQAYQCVASAYVPTGLQKRLSVEVAPVINDHWDTSGYGQNYHFQF